jgi:hypothetical protein
MIIVLLVRWGVLARRFRRLEEQLAVAARERVASAEQISNLTQRVHRLEGGRVAVEAPAAPVAAPVAVAPVVVVAPVAPPLPSRPFAKVCQFCGRSVTPGAARCFCGAVLKEEKPTESRLPPKLAAPQEAAGVFVASEVFAASGVVEG